MQQRQRGGPRPGVSSILFSGVPLTETEQSMRGMLEKAGHILSFRMVVSDHGDTYFGFCDFTDALSAQAAVAALHGNKLAGAERAIRCVISERKRKREQAQAMEFAPVEGIERDDQFKLPPIDPMHIALNHIPVSDAYEAVEQLRILALEHPATCEQLLVQYPQLAIATVMIMQHAKKLDKTLPDDSWKPVELQTASTGQAVVEHSSATIIEKPAHTGEEDIVSLIESFSEEEILNILNLTPQQLEAIPDANTRQQMQRIQKQLKEMEAGLEE